MTDEAALYAFRECIEGGWPVQVTTEDDITFDFKHQIHANVLFETLVEQGFEVGLDPEISESGDHYYARVC